MYESHFLLSQRPFAAAPSADVYLAIGSLEQARQTLIRCVDRGEGVALVVGPAGTGKSLLCQVLTRHFRGRFQSAILGGARLCTRRALLQNILFELKLPYRDMDEGELRLSLVDHLEPRSGGSDGLLLIVDEAHMLPLRLLEEVRLLTNIARDGQSRVRLLLAGTLALEERLASPKLESFHQRIAARCYVQPLARHETIGYVQEQVRRCGTSADSLFTAEAQAAIHTATDGIPRLINQLCDHALMLAALGGHRQLDAAGIEEAWADLQQLPLPAREQPAAAAGPATGGIVEFGQLREEPTIVAGTIGPTTGDAAVAHIDAITQTLETLQTDSKSIVTAPPSDFSPAATGGTEVELLFHGAHDPFGGNWEEEEVVIDRYASLEDAALRGRRVTSEQGRALGAAVAAAASGLPPIAGNGPTSAADSDQPSVEVGQVRCDEAVGIGAAREFHPADDPLLPEEPAIAPPGPVSLRALAPDDRDMILVDEDQSPRPAPLASRPRRAEYRQLFSTLRKK